MSDPIANMLTSLRNANHRFFEKVDVPVSKIAMAISKILKEEGFIANYKVMENGKTSSLLRLYLRYTPVHERVLRGVQRVSRPGLRVYRGYSKLRWLLSDLHVVVVSTPKGIMTAREACRAKLGGEVICKVW